MTARLIEAFYIAVTRMQTPEGKYTYQHIPLEWVPMLEKSLPAALELMQLKVIDAQPTENKSN